MGDRSYMTVIVDDCPTKKRKVAELLAEYELTPNMWDDDAKTFLPVPEEIEVGEQYTVEEISIGSATELAGRLIELAPRCSFWARQEPHYTCSGDLVCYTPKLGRFDGEVDNDGTVIKGRNEIARLLDEAEELGIGGTWGQRAVLDVAFGVPWLRERKPGNPDRATWKLWLKVIDASEARTWRQRREQLASLTTKAGNAGLAAVAVALQAVWDAPPPDQIAVALAAQETAEQTAREAATDDVPAYNTPQGSVAYGLRNWADASETVWQGRRRPTT